MNEEIIEWVIHPGNDPRQSVLLKLQNRPGVHPLANGTDGRLRVMEVPEGCRALDLGCGCGVFGLYLALAGAADVTLTEIDPEALECARENAALNELANVRFLLGDMFEPVRGEKFDLIVANLPQTPAPKPFRPDKWGGPLGDQYLMRLCAEVPSFLNESGRLYFLHTGLANFHAVRAAFGAHFDLVPRHVYKRVFTPGEYDSYQPGLFDYLAGLKEQGKAVFREEGGKYFFFTYFYRADWQTRSYTSR